MSILPSRQSSPEFGPSQPEQQPAHTSRELYCRLFVHPEENVHLYEPAFRFASRAVGDVAPAPSESADPDQMVGELLREAELSLDAAGAISVGPALALHLIREWAPVGLSDGAWLRGSLRNSAIESPVGMALLQQFMLRFGDPSSTPAYARRFSALLMSIGIVPDQVTEWRPSEASPCDESSYEHALLGICLGLFPSVFLWELVGFNLWMAAIGPAPILAQLHAPLSEMKACTDYLAAADGPALAQLARQAVSAASLEPSTAALLGRIRAGYLAAHASYLKWQEAALAGGRGVALHTAAGASRPKASSERRAAASPEPSHAIERLRGLIRDQYGRLSNEDVYYCLVNADLHPAVQLLAKTNCERMLSKLARVLDTDERLNSTTPPHYSEQGVAEMVNRQHELNVRARAEGILPGLPTGSSHPAAKPNISPIFDGCWLQGFADVARAEFEDYRWLFRIYASEHGDGDMAWNHCQIFRRSVAGASGDVMLPKSDRRLYDSFEIGLTPMLTLASSLNTAHFLPELLGLNLAIEATGVAGIYLEDWKTAERHGSKWKALAFRLHNSIDNYADGHTKWSLAAVQSFMRRVKDSAPSETSAQWHRIWRLWRCQEIIRHGTPSERQALAEHFNLTSLAPA